MPRAELHSLNDLLKLKRGDVVSFTPDRTEPRLWNTKYLFYEIEDGEIGFISRGIDRSAIYLLSYFIEDLTVSVSLVSVKPNGIRRSRMLRPRLGYEWGMYEAILLEHQYDFTD